MRVFAFLCTICIALANSARAEEAKQFVNDEPVTVQGNTAYLLVRTNLIDGEWIMDPLLVRAMSPSEVSSAGGKGADGSNVIQIHDLDFYNSTPDERVFVVALEPGTYVLAGIATSGGAGDVCMCMGTVKFNARPGVLTDLGMVLMARDDKPTNVPELSSQVRGKDIGVEPRLLVMGLRPYSANMQIPPALAGIPRVVADFRAVGWFPNYLGASVDRLAPVSGILAYDKDGHVLDLKVESSAVSRK